MNAEIEEQLTEILEKEEWTKADWELLDEESDRYAPKFSEALQVDEPAMKFHACRIRGIEKGRIVFAVWYKREWIHGLLGLLIESAGLNPKPRLFGRSSVSCAKRSGQPSLIGQLFQAGIIPINRSAVVLILTEAKRQMH
jgi:hypothetical protein